MLAPGWRRDASVALLTDYSIRFRSPIVNTAIGSDGLMSAESNGSVADHEVRSTTVVPPHQPRHPAEGGVNAGRLLVIVPKDREGWALFDQRSGKPFQSDAYLSLIEREVPPGLRDAELAGPEQGRSEGSQACRVRRRAKIFSSRSASSRRVRFAAGFGPCCG